MPLDTFFLSGLAEELNNTLSGARIDKIQQPGKDLLIFAVRGINVNGRLLICGGSNGFRIHMTEAVYENPRNPPMFCMLLRKHLIGARIDSVSQASNDRILEIKLNTFDAMGSECVRRLILEFMGRYTNVILAAEDGLIIDCMHRTGGLESPRSVLPGLYYRLPEPQNKLDLFKTEGDELKRLTESAPPLKTCDKWLLDTFSGLSPLICREICFRSYGAVNAMMEDVLADDKGKKLTESLIGLKKIISCGAFTPVLLSDSGGKPRDFSYTEIEQYRGILDSEIKDSFSQLLDAFFTKRDMANRMREKSQSIVKAVKNARDRTARRLANQQKELEATADREVLRQSGDIIMANLHAVKRGDTVLDAYDFYSEDGSNRRIRLDPAKNPHQNAARYYKEYTKAKNASVILAEQTAKGRDELYYLDSVLEELDRVEYERDLDEIRTELARSGYLKDRQDKRKKTVKQQRPMEFCSSMGLSVFVGRNNSENDELTRSASKRDIWLHTQKIHGSHVIIRVVDGDPDDTTLKEAASLAAFYSQARESDKVPVDYTQVRFVKKPNGAKPGMVTYTNQRTITAEPDEELVKKLRK